MNGLLLGAASLGTLVLSLARTPEALATASEARLAIDDAEVARLMAAAPDVGEFGEVTITDPETGARTTATVQGFRD